MSVGPVTSNGSPRTGQSAANFTMTATAPPSGTPTKRTPVTKSRSVASSSPATPSSKNSSPVRKSASPASTASSTKQLRVEKLVPFKNPVPKNNAPIKPVTGGWGAPFNPFGLKQPKYRVAKYSSLGHAPPDTSATSVSTNDAPANAQKLLLNARQSLVDKTSVSKVNDNAKTSGSAGFTMGARVPKGDDHPDPFRLLARLPDEQSRVVTQSFLIKEGGDAPKKASGNNTSGVTKGGAPSTEERTPATKLKPTAKPTASQRKATTIQRDTTKKPAPLTKKVSQKTSTSKATAPAPKRAPTAPMYGATSSTNGTSSARPSSKRKAPQPVAAASPSPPSDSGISMAAGEQEPPQKKLKKQIDTRTAREKRTGPANPHIPFLLSDSSSDGYPTPAAKRRAEPQASAGDALVQSRGASVDEEDEDAAAAAAAEQARLDRALFSGESPKSKNG